MFCGKDYYMENIVPYLKLGNNGYKEVLVDVRKVLTRKPELDGGENEMIEVIIGLMAKNPAERMSIKDATERLEGLSISEE